MGGDDLGDQGGIKRALPQTDLRIGGLADLDCDRVRRLPLGQGGPADLGEHAVLQVKRRKDGLPGEEHLGLAHEKKALVVEGIVQPGQDPGLGLGFEVHQRVSTEEEVDAGDGRVLQKVMAAEDDRPAQVASEQVAASARLEILLAQAGGHLFEVLVHEDALARLAERILIHVRGVDLDALPELAHPQCLDQHHGDGIRLLAAGAAGAPDADGFGRALGRDQPG